MRELKELEERLCRLPGWVDHGTHILIVAEALHRINRGRKASEQTGCGGRTAAGHSPEAIGCQRTGQWPDCSSKVGYDSGEFVFGAQG